MPARDEAVPFELGRAFKCEGGKRFASVRNPGSARVAGTVVRHGHRDDAGRARTRAGNAVEGTDTATGYPATTWLRP
jgi:hypothetical protein